MRRRLQVGNLLHQARVCLPFGFLFGICGLPISETLELQLVSFLGQGVKRQRRHSAKGVQELFCRLSASTSQKRPLEAEQKTQEIPYQRLDALSKKRPQNTQGRRKREVGSKSLLQQMSAPTPHIHTQIVKVIPNFSHPRQPCDLLDMPHNLSKFPSVLEHLPFLQTGLSSRVHTQEARLGPRGSGRSSRGTLRVRQDLLYHRESLSL
mmetsp:Transcript_12368/g.23984  ORF Transcript_12368/g.23984 Transcript_12368/m.23984 type:complete len:208 (-) Transcript_12368:315-938(-)